MRQAMGKDLASETWKWLDGLRRITEQLKATPEAPFVSVDSKVRTILQAIGNGNAYDHSRFPEEMRNHPLLEFHHGVYNAPAKYLRVDPPRHLMLTREERGWLTHDTDHLIDGLGMMGDGKRESLQGFCDAFSGKNHYLNFYSEEAERARKKLEAAAKNNDPNATKLKAVYEEYQRKADRLRIFGGLFDESTLSNALNNWHRNFIDACDGFYFNFSYPAERSGFQTPPSDLETICRSVKGSISNSFYALVHAAGPHKVSVDFEVDGKISVEQPALYHKLLYNLAKNAAKRAEDLYILNRNFKGGNIRMFAGIMDGEVYAGVAQTFDGIDLKGYARFGYDMLKNGHPYVQEVSPESAARYQKWIKSAFGEEFEGMHIKDIVDLAFLANVSGAHISSETSGLGLYAASQLIKKNNGNISYFFKPDDSLLNGEGFVLRLPLVQK